MEKHGGRIRQRRIDFRGSGVEEAAWKWSSDVPQSRRPDNAEPCVTKKAVAEWVQKNSFFRGRQLTTRCWLKRFRNLHHLFGLLVSPLGQHATFVIWAYLHLV